MVRRGSTVRVRQRASLKPLHSGCFCLLFGRRRERSTSTKRPPAGVTSCRWRSEPRSYCLPARFRGVHRTSKRRLRSPRPQASRGGRPRGCARRVRDGRSGRHGTGKSSGVSRLAGNRLSASSVVACSGTARVLRRVFVRCSLPATSSQVLGRSSPASRSTCASRGKAMAIRSAVPGGALCTRILSLSSCSAISG